jgi:hypothetical protein
MPVKKKANDPIPKIKESEFRVLERQEESKNPSKEGPHYPKLAQVAHPHIGAFNSLFSFGSGPGLLEISVNSIPHVVVFDGERGAPVSQRNKVECKYRKKALSKNQVLSWPTGWLTSVQVNLNFPWLMIEIHSPFISLTNIF